MEDETPMTEVLTRATALPQLTSPLGHKYVVSPSPRVPGTFRITREDGNKIPDSISGVYTGRMRAELALHQFLDAMWHMNDEAVAKSQGLRKPTK